MTALYEIANHYHQLLESDDENALAEMKGEFNDKALAISYYIKNIEAECDAVEKARKAMQEREQRLSNKVESLKKYLQDNMERCGISEIKSPHFVIKLKKCPESVHIYNEIELSSDYIKQKVVSSIDRIKIKEDIKHGVIVAGAELIRNNRVEIK